LLLGLDDLENIAGLKWLSFREEPSQHIVDQIKAFVFGCVQKLEILFHCRSFTRALQ